jgi:hypothetical protein
MRLKQQEGKLRGTDKTSGLNRVLYLAHDDPEAGKQNPGLRFIIEVKNLRVVNISLPSRCFTLSYVDTYL